MVAVSGSKHIVVVYVLNLLNLILMHSCSDYMQDWDSGLEVSREKVS